MSGNAPSSGNTACICADRASVGDCPVHGVQTPLKERAAADDEYQAWEDDEAQRLTDKWADRLERQFLRSSRQ